jgi:DNA polymerase III epsilon subunit-like protein
MKCIFIDTETGGLDCKVHALLSVGAVVFDPETGEIGISYYRTMQPSRGYGFTLEALKANGLRIADIDGGDEPYDVFEEFAEWYEAQEAIATWAHNADFDFGFLQQWEEESAPELDIEPMLFHDRPHFVCSKQLLKVAQLRGCYPMTHTSSLKAACEYFGIKPGTHHALNDAVAGARLVCKLWQLFGWTKESQANDPA